MKRRHFLQASLITGGGVFFEGKFKYFAPRSLHQASELNVFVKIMPNNDIVILSPRAEIGTGVFTSLPMLIAEEMNLDWQQVRVELPEKVDRKYGPQGGGGSYAIRSNFFRLRQVGAAIRELMLEAAASTWGGLKMDCYTEKGIVFCKKISKSLRFADLIEKAIHLPIPTNPVLKSNLDFRIIGKFIRNVETRAIITGKIVYGSDLRIKGMLYANIIKPPVLGAQVVNFEDSQAKLINGYMGLVQLDALPNPTHQIGGVAVLANSPWVAMQARKSILVKWSAGYENESSDWLDKQFDEILNGDDLHLLKSEGDTLAVFEKANLKLEATYQVPFLAHAPLEPMNFTAHVQADKCELWGSTQVPNAVFRQAKSILNLPDEAIIVHQCRSGGAFGRRLLVDYAIDAILVSKKIQKPVQVFWTREDDFLHDFQRPAGKYKVKASLDSKGKLDSWHLKATTVSRLAFRLDPNPPHNSEVSEEHFPAGFVPHFKLEYKHPSTHFPVGAWRAPGDNATAFVVQSMLDEMAHLAQKDPIDFRLEIIGDHGPISVQNPEDGYNAQDLKAVLLLVKEKSGWGKPLAKGHFQGVAAHATFGVPVALIVEISMLENKLKVHRITAAVVCGIVVNPNHAEHQIVGGVIDGLGAALYGEITYDKGAVQQRNFHQYQLLRMNEVPPVEVHFVPSQEPPKGLGEMGLPPLAPALCNAIFAATGKRIRKLPIILH
jgi:isoquinoline 1-oxidoreductase subunit beta